MAIRSTASFMAALLVTTTGAWAGQIEVSKIEIQNNSVGDALVKVVFDCDKNGDGKIDPKKEAYACQIGYSSMEGNQAIAAAQDLTIGKSDIGNAIASGTRIGIKITNGNGQRCEDHHPPDGDDVIYVPGNGKKINFKVTGDAITGLSCHFKKD